MDEELIPCPFCGSDKVEILGQVLFHCHCIICGARSGVHTNKGYAISIWNTRPIEATLRSEVDACHRRIAQLTDMVDNGEKF